MKFEDEIEDRIARFFDGSRNIFECIQCGMCTGSCPSGYFTALNTRIVIKKAYSGDESILENDALWECTTCYTCQERCPRGVKVTDIIKVIRNIAAQRGMVKEEHKKLCLYLFNYGHVVPIDENVRKIRKKIGLPEIPPTIASSQKYLEELRKILKHTKFDEVTK